MKLKTMMAIECGEVFPLFDGGGDAMPAFEHDAAAAHALMIAMDEQQLIAYRLAVAAIKRRADEILAEWGYREERYETL
ncbi:hypothetical protein ACQKIE_12070 [Luteibacter sp. NPDC031894]|uniref:hypothetical protein n=1 Tax=Luteibacter sp. NPDC031894 TaxID=3390572 RepID=UPI003D06B295